MLQGELQLRDLIDHYSDLLNEEAASTKAYNEKTLSIGFFVALSLGQTRNYFHAAFSKGQMV